MKISPSSGVNIWIVVVKSWEREVNNCFGIQVKLLCNIYVFWMHLGWTYDVIYSFDSSSNSNLEQKSSMWIPF